MAKKVTKKAAKKTATKGILMDCTNLETVNDVYRNYIYAKALANVPITAEEVKYIEDNAVIDCTIHTCILVEAPKKLPWYKRFWKWLFRK